VSRFEGLLETNTESSLDEVFGWLASLSNWVAHDPLDSSGHRRVCKLHDGSVTAIVIDSGNYKPGSAASSIDTLGTPRTIVIDMFVSRTHHIGRIDEMYAVAFGFCNWAPSCNAIFAVDDDNRGVFLRRNGLYLINPEEFFSKSLAAFLTFPYELADPPECLLSKAGWPNQDANRTNR